MKNIISFLILSISVFLSACSDDDADATTATLTLEFDNIAGDKNLQLNTAAESYTNSKQEPYKVTTLRYYISNIQLTRVDGTVYKDAVSPDGSAGYYLIDESDASSREVTLKDIPAGEYNAVTFTVGVDASQVSQGAQTGALDPAHNLFWSWNSGYIFLQLEGESSASAEPDHVFQYHVGGYKDINNLKTITLSFNGDVAPVRAEHEPEVHLLFDINKFLAGPVEAVTFTSKASRHSPAACVELAGNISTAFVVDHVHEN